MSNDFAHLHLDNSIYDLPIITGTTGERAVDIRGLLRDTGCITLAGDES